MNIENIHSRVLKNITLISNIIEIIQKIIPRLRDITKTIIKSPLIQKEENPIKKTSFKKTTFKYYTSDIIKPSNIDIPIDEFINMCNLDITTIKTSHQNIINSYILSSVNILIEYYKTNIMNTIVIDKYYRCITTCNIFYAINDIVKRISFLIKFLEENINSDNTVIDSDICLIKYNMFSIKNEIIVIDNTIKFGECCGMQMIVVSETSELLCQSCNKIKKIDGVIFKNDQFYPQDGHKTKHGTYDSMRHYKFWIEHIQGKDVQVFPEGFLKNIESYLLRNQPNRKLITYDQVRKALKDPSIKATHLNIYVSLLLKIISGNICSTLSYEENSLASFKFSRVMALYGILKSNKIINLEGKKKPYYPYFIYKILEHMLWDSPKLRILNFIYLQSRKTVIKNDIIFKKICEISNQHDFLVYKATNHGENMIQIERNNRLI